MMKTIKSKDFYKECVNTVKVHFIIYFHWESDNYRKIDKKQKIL